MKLLLTSATRADLWQLAERRNGAKKPEWTRRKSTIFSDVELDFLGLVGEKAASVVLGVPFDRKIHSHGDDGTDLKLQDGRIVAVKFNHRHRGYFMFEERDGDRERTKLKDFSADIGVAVYGPCDPPRECVCCKFKSFHVWVAGWIERETFLQEYEYKDWGYGGRYIMRVELLKDLSDLKITGTGQSRP